VSYVLGVYHCVLELVWGFMSYLYIEGLVLRGKGDLARGDCKY